MKAIIQQNRALKQSLVLFVSFFLTACSFNKMFLAPSKIPKEAKFGILIDYQKKDTLKISIGRNFQPSFINKKNDTINLAYKIESVLFNNSNSTTLNGWIMSPYSNFNGTTILFLHGNAGNITTHFTGVIPLVEKGFQIFIFDYSGFGFSQGKATRDNVLLDANAALDYIISKKNMNTDKIVIYGQSLGGHLAVTVASNNQNKIDGLIIEGAFSSAKDIAALSAGIFGRILVSEKYSALKSIKNYKKPLLIIHSKEDETIPFAMGKKLIKNANEPKTFYEINKCHMCGPLYYSDSISSKIIRMINR